MNFALTYIEEVSRLIKEIKDTQLDNIEKSAICLAETIQNGNKIHAFGTGHSHILAEEIFYRAGGLVNINPILEESLMLHDSASKSTQIERLEGYGEIIFDCYGLNAGDTIFVFSNSGRNGVCIDLAKLCSERGLNVIVITSMKATMAGASRHSSGKRLYEFGDIVIDNCGCVGDACVTIEDNGKKAAPTSTITGSMILHAICVRAIEIMTENGFVPDVFVSSNVDGGDAVNEKFIEKYKKEIKSL